MSTNEIIISYKMPQKCLILRGKKLNSLKFESNIKSHFLLGF